MSELDDTKYSMSIEDKDGVIIVHCAGEFDFETIPSLREVLKTEVPDEFKKIIVNSKDVTFLDSTGVGLFASLLKKAHQQKQNLALVGASGQPKAVLGIIGFDDLVDYFDTVDAACANL